MRSTHMFYANRARTMSEAFYQAMIRGEVRQAIIIDHLLKDAFNRGNARCPIKFEEYEDTGIMWPIQEEI